MCEEARQCVKRARQCVKGHDFSRANRTIKTVWALAPAGLQALNYYHYPQARFRCGRFIATARTSSSIRTEQTSVRIFDAQR